MIIFERGSSYRQSGNFNGDFDYDFTFTTITFHDTINYKEYVPDITVEERVDNLDNGDTDYIVTLNDVFYSVDDTKPFIGVEGDTFEFKNLLEVSDFITMLTNSWYKVWRDLGLSDSDFDLVSDSTELF